MEIKLLTEETISRIAAGEVIERPLNVVKELVENSIDAGSTAITVEIRDGGISMIRVTDNGCGIERDQIAKAFVRHATSKIRDAEDLSSLSSLGFRGEALASISSVARVEMITKVRGELSGTRALNDRLASFSPDAPVQIDLEEIGAPDGTTVIVRDLFGQIPVRRRFLRQPQTEAGYITDLIEKQALSHPRISFHYRVNGQDKLHTTGNGDLKELIYRIYGRETAGAVIPVHAEDPDTGMVLDGLLGKPEVSRSSRSFETFFINGRMLRSKELSAGLEEGYRTDLMQHRFPFAVLHLTMPPADLDVNVHPSKMEVRFSDRRAVFRFLNESVHAALHRTELIPKATLNTAAQERDLARKESRLRDKVLRETPALEAFESGRAALPPLPPSRSGAAAAESPVQDPDRTQETAKEPPASSLNRSVSQNHSVSEKPEASQKQEIYQKQETSQRPEIYQEQETSQNPAAAQRPSFVQKAPASAATDLPFVFEDRRANAGPGPETDLNREYKKPLVHDLVSSEEGPGEEALHPVAAESSAGRTETAGHPAAAETGAGHTETEQMRLSDLLPDMDQTEDDRLLSSGKAEKFKYIGQVFGTYWLIEYEKQLLIIDQHAAHEKVNYERIMRRIEREHPALDSSGTVHDASPEAYLALDRLLEEDADRTSAGELTDSGPENRAPEGTSPVFVASQQLLPPIVIRFSGREESAYLQFKSVFAAMGYEIEEFGSGAYTIRAVPAELFGRSADSLLRETLEEIMNERISGTPRAIISKVASMSCKAAVKGNSRLSETEARALIGELLTLDNPYHCPHGRPTMIVMNQHEMDRKFRRIV
ncbi:MAG: DNA mismatch repair endonuclease MutL [Sarcina sp.]|nr:DNA mismatch repair endonuclease MutL [Sarcina sp.]